MSLSPCHFASLRKKKRRDDGFRKSTLIQVSLAQGEEHNEVLRESQTGLSHQTKKRLTQKRVMISRIFPGTICTVITFKKESHPMYRKRGSFPIPLKFFLMLLGSTNATMDVLLESRIDNCWNVDGDRELWRPWSVFTQFTFVERNVREEINKRSGNIQARLLMTRGVVMYVEKISTEGKRHWAVEKPQLDNARKLTAAQYIDPE